MAIVATSGGAKKFEMPGQTKELDSNAPDSTALKIFYSTLHTQRPESELASRWLLQHGLLEHDEAERQCKLLKVAPKKPPSVKRQANDEDDFESAPKGKGKGKAPKGKKSAGSKKKDDSSEDESFQEAPKKKAGKTAAPKTKPKAKPPPKVQKRAPKASAAVDDSSEEEELPLNKRKKSTAKAAPAPAADDSSDDSSEEDVPLSQRGTAKS
uniref:Uncharacterized protein n=1 Tax=Calcidiscus leptoporus TaxID=127549 RepID=A0A7S0IRY2_9EUKA|mmetsp:Transcript_18857/g.43316  ORF Transcript_18857/g.43316 Transcript_18857/m.43316 type:complete len:211 (+) Transcript_18857:103-735(+)